MSRIREYPLFLGSGSDVQLISMPRGAIFAGVVNLADTLTLLMSVDPPAIHIDRVVRVCVSEEEAPDRTVYAGSAEVLGTLYHVFLGRYVNDPRK